ncbi:hypothetical protein IV203_006762 [Nitzschia inconspicua]|uniref:Uncharacterized protein n=1 Tax=Nitzschia inconspicua TaxID=303405 RepID=A0A9K3PAP9_9STRA|nr:hypothetical protein IV203_006762 [Nitzschia inconspicua]
MGDETAFTVRGIDNISNVSCHVSCAIQILCHAIPPIRQLLLSLLDHYHGTGETNNGTTIPNSHNVLVNELLDFVSGGSSRPHTATAAAATTTTTSAATTTTAMMNLGLFFRLGILDASSHT